MELEEFKKLVNQVLDELPTEFLKKLENIEVVVEELPSKQLLQKLNVSQNSCILGLYQGVPQLKRGMGYSFVLPDKITLFKKNIEAKTGRENIKDVIRNTLVHEIAHHFGISDRRLKDLKLY